MVRTSIHVGVVLLMRCCLGLDGLVRFFAKLQVFWVGADRVYLCFFFSVIFSRLPWHSVFLRIFVTRPSSVPSYLRVGCLGPQSTCSVCGGFICLGVGFDWGGCGL